MPPGMPWATRAPERPLPALRDWRVATRRPGCDALPMTAPADAPRHYDLHFRAGGKRMAFRNPDHGVTLDGARIGWTANGRDDGQRLAEIANVHLAQAGDWRNPVASCAITFNGGFALTLSNGTAWGNTSPDHQPAYRAFIADLHKSLTAPGFAPRTGPVRFTSGYRGHHYYVVIACAVLLGLIGVAAPLVMLLIFWKWEILMVLLGGAGAFLPLLRMVRTNTPADYDPRHPPPELIG